MSARLQQPSAAEEKLPLPAEQQAGNEPEEEAFSAERMLRELEEVLHSGEQAGDEEDDASDVPAEPDEADFDGTDEGEAGAGVEQSETGPRESEPWEDLPGEPEQDPPEEQETAPDEGAVTMQELLDDLEASEHGNRRAKRRAPAPGGKKPRRLRRKAATCFVVLLAAMVIAFQFIGFAVIDGASMTPSLSEHDFLVYWKLPDEIERGEVLLCRSAGYNGQILAKRVIGLPGDVVEVNEEGRVTLNGTRYIETTAVYGTSELGSDVAFPIRVNENSYFVLGDNRAVSVDSRQSVIGQIAREDVIGTVLCWFHIE